MFCPSLPLNHLLKWRGFQYKSLLFVIHHDQSDPIGNNATDCDKISACHAHSRQIHLDGFRHITAGIIIQEFIPGTGHAIVEWVGKNEI
jgi:hypothetical protein